MAFTTGIVQWCPSTLYTFTKQIKVCYLLTILYLNILNSDLLWLIYEYSLLQ